MIIINLKLKVKFNKYNYILRKLNSSSYLVLVKFKGHQKHKTLKNLDFFLNKNLN